MRFSWLLRERAERSDRTLRGFMPSMRSGCNQVIVRTLVVEKLLVTMITTITTIRTIAIIAKIAIIRLHKNNNNNH